MKDVAARAGVSVSTVSHVLNRTRAVAPDTQERVHAALAELGYEGVGLGQQVPAAIGFVVANTSYAYFAEVVQGAEAEARRRGYALFLCDSHDDPDYEAQAISTLLSHRADGVLLSPTSQWRRTALPVLRRKSTPFVLVDRLTDVRCDQVVSENVAPAETLVSHLAELGHTRIAILTGLPDLSTTAERLLGYQRALRRWRLDFDEKLVVPGQSTSRGGKTATRELLNLPDPPSAIFCSNDAMTVGALQALRDAGCRVPDDVAIVAFDDFEWADMFTPSMTVAAQPAYTIGAEAVKLLDSRLRHDNSPAKTVRLPAEVVHRTSCGCDHLPAVRRRHGS
jgi:LacI family transcriptional regulator